MDGPKVTNRLGELMAERGLGIQKLSRMAEVSPNTIIKLRQNATRYLDVFTTARICRALDVELGDLFLIENDSQ